MQFTMTEMYQSETASPTVLKWSVYAACCTVACLDFAVVFTFGAMFDHLLDKYGADRTTTATVQSLLMGIAISSGVFSGMLVKKAGVWRVSLIGSLLVPTGFIVASFAKSILVLDVFIGVFSGVGINLLFVSSTIAVGRVFEGASRETALALQSFTMGVGGICYPYSFDYLTFEFGVSGTFLLLGGIYLNNFVITLLFLVWEKRCGKQLSFGVKDPHEEIYEHKSQASNGQRRSEAAISKNVFSLVGVWKAINLQINVQFVLLLTATAIVMASYNGFLVVFVDVLAWKGLSSAAILVCFTTNTAVDSITRVLIVVLSKLRPETHPAVLCAVGAFCGCVGQLIICFSNSKGLLMVGSGLAGVCVGGTYTSSVMVLSRIVTIQRFGVSFGVLLSAIGVLSLAIGPLYGYIWDRVQSYAPTILLTVAMQGTGTLLYIFIGLREFCKNRKKINPACVPTSFRKTTII